MKMIDIMDTDEPPRKIFHPAPLAYDKLCTALFPCNGEDLAGFLQEINLHVSVWGWPALGQCGVGMSRKGGKIPRLAASAAGVDGKLLARCLEGSPEAREEFVEKTRALIHWALVVTFRRYDRPLEEEDLEDFRQDILVALFSDHARKLRQYESRNGATLATWLRVVVTRFAIDRIRQRSAGVRLESLEKVLPEAEGEVDWNEDSAPEKAVLDAERRQQVLGLLRELSPGDQLFVRLFYYQDATIEEVAEVMGISRNAAYVRKMRLHRRLRSLLEQRP